MNLTITTPASTPAFSLEEAKEHLRVEHTDDDDLIGRKTNDATIWAETFTQRSFVDKQYALGLDGFVSRVKIPMPPTVSIDSVEYVDADGNTQTLADTEYQANLWGQAYVDFTGSLPSTADQPNAVVINFTAGYSGAIPGDVVAAIKLYLGLLYENRENVVVGTIVSQVPQSATDLLQKYIVMEGLG